MAKDLGKLFSQASLARRPPLYRWMYRHHDVLSPAVNVSRPSWTALATTAAQDGQKAKNGEPYPRQVMWRTWRQVEKDLDAAKKVPTKTKLLVEPAIAPTASIKTDEGTTHVRPERPGSGFTFRSPTKAADNDRLVGKRDPDKK